MRTTAFLACIMAAITASADVLIGNGDRIAFLGDSITANGNPSLQVTCTEQQQERKAGTSSLPERSGQRSQGR